MKKKHIFNIFKKQVSLFLLFCFFVFPLNNLTAQTLPEDILDKSEKKQAKSHVAITSIKAIGMTESSAQALSMRLSQNLQNTNHFVVTSSETLRNQLGQSNPELLGCVDLGCSVQAGRVIGADRIIHGKISVEKSGNFRLNMQLVNVSTSNVEYEDLFIFGDDDIDRTFHLLSKKLVENTPLLGTLIEVNNITATISLGSNQGIRVGDQVVMFKDKDKNTPMEVNKTEASIPEKNISRNIGILKITQVSKESSKGIYFQKVELPVTGQKIRTYLNRSRQIMLVSEVRKELDTFERLTYDEVPTVVEQVELIDHERIAWVKKVRYWEKQRDLFQMILIGSGVTAVYAVTQLESSGDDFRVLIPLALTGYSTFGYIQSRSNLNDLVDEGRYKGYIELKIIPTPQGISMNMEWRF